MKQFLLTQGFGVGVELAKYRFHGYGRMALWILWGWRRYLNMRLHERSKSWKRGDLFIDS